MPTPGLHGNGEACHACELQRSALAKHAAAHGFAAPARVPCQLCGGTGRLAFTAEAIVAAEVEEARRTYWPAARARWAEPIPASGLDAPPRPDRDLDGPA